MAGRTTEAWSGRMAFILASVGAAVGLGNIWKFPYTLGSSGGSAFVLIYVLAMLLIATLLRLALNVASTRVVLLEGHNGGDAAGKVIEAFGEFVIGGSGFGTLADTTVTTGGLPATLTSAMSIDTISKPVCASSPLSSTLRLIRSGFSRTSL